MPRDSTHGREITAHLSFCCHFSLQCESYLELIRMIVLDVFATTRLYIFERLVFHIIHSLYLP